MREFQLLQHVYAANDRLPADVVIPPGDDMGAVRIGNQTLLVAVDQVADAVHFDLAKHELAAIARKAITRNLSDVAAMAAKPVGAVVAATLPSDFAQADANKLFDAMRATAEHYACPLVGGDVSIWSGKLLLSVTVFAEPAGIGPVLRQGAKAGDAIYVTGQLGGSLSTGHHLTFEPRLNVARLLAGNSATRPHCMIDLSDGLARDLGHLCDAANVSAVVDASKLPIRCGDWRNAVGDGEDYELLLTSDGLIPEEVQGTKVTCVGEIVPRSDNPKVAIRLADATILDLAQQGWEHHT